MVPFGPPDPVPTRYWSRSPWPWVGLGLGLLLTFAVWGMLSRAEGDRLMGLHISRATVMAKHLEDRVQGLEQVLRGASGYLGRGRLPTRQEWQAYVASLNLPSHSPGLQGLSYVAWVPHGQLKAHEAAVRQEGFPDYAVAPGGSLPADPDGFGVIHYIEPMDARNQRAFGKDMLVDPLRREALLAARDHRLVSLSAPVTLYQETEAEPQVGAVLYAPVYAQGTLAASIAERRRTFRGWAAIPLRMTDLIEANLGRDLRTLDLQLVDATPGGPERPLFTSASGPSQTQRHAVTRSFIMGGRTWQARIAPNATFFVEAGYRHHWEVLVSGTVVSLLLFTLLMLMHGAEHRARELARQREAELRDTELRFQALFESAPIGMAIVDSLTGRFLSVNPRLGEILGTTPAELLEHGFQQVTHPDHLVADLASVQQLISGALPEVHKEKRYVHRDGHTVWGRLSMVRLPSQPGSRLRHLALVEDITEARLRQTELEDSEARWQFALEGAGEGVWDWTAESEQMFLSRGYRSMLGYELDEDMGTTFTHWLERIHPEDRDTVVAAVNAYLEQRSMGYQTEYRIRRKDGSFIWVLARGMAVARDASGRPTRIIGTHVDITERKLAEETLRRSESDLALAQAIGDFGSWRVTFSEAGDQWSCSDGLRKIYGYAPDQAITMQSGFDVMHPEDREPALAAWQRGLEGTGPLEYEHRIIVGGETKWLAVRSVFQRSEQGQLMEASGIVQDITERKLAEEALRSSEARLHILADHLPDSFLYQLLAKPGEAPRFIYLSEGVERLCGVSREAACQDPSLLFGQMDPEMVPAYREAEAASGRGLSPFTMDFRNRRADGSWRWFRVRSAPSHQPDGSLVWEGIATDITEPKLAQMQVETSEARFRSVVERAGDAIYLFDASGQILLSNLEACASTGYALEELLTMSIVDLDPRFSEPSRIQRRAAMVPNQMVLTQTQHRRKDGFSIPVEIRTALIQTEPSRQFLAVVRDLTVREELQASELRARKAESLVLMAGSIAHDFNNLFQGVLGYLEVAMARAEGQPYLLHSLEKAEDTLRKAIGLSWKMLDFSGRGLLRAERVDLESWLPPLLADLHLSLPAGFHLDLSCAQVPFILADIAKMEEVVRALVDNAREAAEGTAGWVRLRVWADFGEDQMGPSAPGFWPLARPQGPATVCLEVQDNGPGVPADTLHLICDPFYTTKQMGRGLGLASAVGILNAHRAGLHILNREGGGLILRMHFPPGGA